MASFSRVSKSNKGIGLPYEESLTFWRRAFKNMSDDQFQKGGHPYNIRHSYGLEGKRTNYTSYSCMKIITSNQPGAGDHHGCPFKHFSSDNLKPLLTGMISSATNLAPGSNQVQAHVLDVSNLSKSGHFQLACTKLFEITHQKPGAAPISIDTIEHPNQYFELSRNGVEGKSSGEVVVMDSSETVHHDVLMDASMDDLVFNDIDGSNDMMDNVDNNVETVNVADDLQAIETQENDEKMQDVEQVMEVDQVSNVEQEVVKMEVIELPKEEIMLDAQDTSEAVPAISSSKEEIMADVDSNEATKEKEQDERMQD